MNSLTMTTGVEAPECSDGDGAGQQAHPVSHKTIPKASRSLIVGLILILKIFDFRVCLPRSAIEVKRWDYGFFFGAVIIGKLSVRKGTAGNPSSFHRFTTG